MKRLSVFAIIFIFMFAVIPNLLLADEPIVDVTYPNGAEELRIGDLIQISFSVTYGDGEGLVETSSAEYSTNNGADWTDVDDVAEGDDYDVFWTIPNDPSEECLVRVTVVDTSGDTGVDLSDGNFEIMLPAINEQHFAPGWSLISFPVIPDPDFDTLEDIFGEDFIRLFVVYGWAPDRGHFAPDTIAHGLAYFLGTTEDAELDIDEYTVNEAESHVYDLAWGWNMIGTPWFERVDLLEATVTVGIHGGPMPFGEAVEREFVGPVGYNFFHNTPDELLPDEELQRYFEHQEFLPWRGYWFMSIVDSVVLEVEPTGPYPTIDAADDATPDNWYIDFIGVLDQTADVCRLGSREGATDGFNAVHDWPQPPDAPVENPVRLYFDHSGWGARAGENFSRDIRAPFAEGAASEWTITVSTGQPGEITIYWPELLETIPSSDGSYYEVTMTDTETDDVFNLREVESYTFNSEGDRDFAIRVETALSVTDNGSELPINFGISSIYPNPFNSTTIINYKIDNSADIKLALFDLAGREVAILAQGNLEAGNYTAALSGESFESGVYLVHLTSSNQSHTEKLTLIK